MSVRKKLLVIISFNVALMIAETLGGLISGSMALLSDAAHMLTDTTALVVSYVALYLAARAADSGKTFGWQRAEVLAALFNGALLAALAGVIFYESVSRFRNPVEIKTGIMLTVSLAGLAGNFAGMLLLRGEHAHNLNVKGAYFHIVSDLLSSLAVVAGAVLIKFSGFYVVDAVLGVILSVFIVRNAAFLAAKSLNILMEAVPSDLSIREMVAEIRLIPGVKDFHDVHVWSLSPESRALSAHILMDDVKTSESQKILCAVRGVLESKYRIKHTTLETECGSCDDRQCYYA